jgi:glutamine amidotransferase
MTVILDYGINNLSSVAKAVRFVGHEARVSTSVAGATRLIIPGVGAFGAAMQRLAPIQAEIRELAENGVPILGICLGMQLLFDSSEEFGYHAGLGLIPGAVRYLPKAAGLKIPHMGWSPLQIRRSSPILGQLEPGDRVYFVHSLAATCAEESDLVATCEYGTRFSAVVNRGSVWGTQFHPEKSGTVGMHILKNFLTEGNADVSDQV